LVLRFGCPNCQPSWSARAASSVKRRRGEELEAGLGGRGGELAEVGRRAARGSRRQAACSTSQRPLWRDHVKASLGKVGVASRPELTAKLFAEHFLPALD
jgi:hypothetical protein